MNELVCKGLFNLFYNSRETITPLVYLFINPKKLTCD